MTSIANARKSAQPVERAHSSRPIQPAAPLYGTLTFRTDGDQLIGTEGHLYLGSVRVITDVTDTLREFNLPTAVPASDARWV